EQCVNVVLTLDTTLNAVVVPSQAVQIGQSGPYIYVVKQDQTVESRPIKPGTELEGFTVIENGVSVGENVVTDGQLKLTPGAKVSSKPSPTENQRPESKTNEGRHQK